MDSWIQNHILLELTRHTTRRYSELRPRDVEGNLFAYHLKGIMSEGLVEKHERAYRLTAKGKQLAERVSLKTGKVRRQPKVLTAVIARNKADEYLLIRWRRQPNTDLISFPYGLVHYGESILDMVALELAEKAGLVADFTYCGDVYVRVIQEDDVYRHMLVHIFEAKNIRPAEEAALRPELSESFWARLDTISPNQYVPGFYEIAQAAARGSISGLQEFVIRVLA